MVSICRRVANSKALAVLGITKTTPDPAGGIIRRGSNGEPNGVLEETAHIPALMKLLGHKTPKMTMRYVEVAQADGRLDAEYKVALRVVHEHLIEEPNKIDHAADLVIAIKALERIGDHAKNIARYVIFLVEGKDVRHVKTKHLGEELSSS